MQFHEKPNNPPPPPYHRLQNPASGDGALFP